MQHYVSLHTQVIQSIKPLLGDRNDNEPIFEYNSLVMVETAKDSTTRIKTHFVLGDLRKFAEQYGDIIGWEASNRAYILTHGVSGIDWKHYKHPLPENVYDVYATYWKDMRFCFRGLFVYEREQQVPNSVQSPLDILSSVRLKLGS